MSLEQLRAHLAETLKRVERMGALYNFFLLPGLFAMSQFEELYRELFKGASTLDAVRLLQGFENKTVEGDRALWRLSHAARAAPNVREILSGHAAHDVIPTPAKSDATRTFLTDLRVWLAQYGQRQLIGDIDRTEEILRETAAPADLSRVGLVCGDPAATPNDVVGYGVVDAYAAVKRALTEKGTQHMKHSIRNQARRLNQCFEKLACQLFAKSLAT